MKIKIKINLILLLMLAALVLSYFLIYESGSSSEIEFQELSLKPIISEKNNKIYECDLSEINLNKDDIENIYDISKSYFVKMNQDGASEDSIDYFSFLSGINVVRGRYIRGGYNTNITLPPYGESDFKLGNIEDINAVKSFIFNHDVTLLEDRIQSNHISGKTFFASNDEMLTLVSMVMKGTNFNNQKVTMLIDLGIVPTVSDLMYASKNGADPLLINDLLQHSSVIVGERYIFLGSYHSFLLESIINGQFESAMYWLDAHDNPEPDKVLLNALDAVVFAKDKFKNTSDVHSLIIKLLNSGLTPNVDVTVNYINNMFQNVNVIQDMNFSISDEELSLSKQFYSNFETSITQYLVTKLPVSQMRAECNSLLVSNVVNNALEKWPALHSLHTESNLTSTSNNKIDYKSILSKFGDNESAEQFLGRYQTVKSKQDVYEFRKQRLLALSIGDNKNLPSGELLSKYISDSKLIGELLENGKFDEAKAYYEKSVLYDPQTGYTNLLALTLDKSPNSSNINKLLELGSTIPDAAVLSMVLRNDVSSLEFLYSKGMKLDYIDPMGNDALTIASTYGSQDALNFLLHNGLTASSDSLSFDALDFALINFKNNNSYKETINLLLKSGISIEPSHKQTVANFLRNKDLATYTYFVHEHPELID